MKYVHEFEILSDRNCICAHVHCAMPRAKNGQQHCCQIAGNSATLLKSSGKNIFCRAKVDSGTAIKFALILREKSGKIFSLTLAIF